MMESVQHRQLRPPSSRPTATSGAARKRKLAVADIRQDQPQNQHQNLPRPESHQRVEYQRPENQRLESHQRAESHQLRTRHHHQLPSGAMNGATEKASVQCCGDVSSRVVPIPLTPLTRFSNAFAICPPRVPAALRNSGAECPQRLTPQGVPSKVKVILKLCNRPATESTQIHFKVDPKKVHLTLFDTLQQPGLGGSSTGGAGCAATVGSGYKRASGWCHASNFDQIVLPSDSLADLCESSLCEALRATYEGCDACVLSYGQSKLGKTDTMIGSSKVTSSSQPYGVIPSAIYWLHKMLEEGKGPESKVKVKLSAFAVRGQDEELQDLLLDVTSNDGSGLMPVSGPLELVEDEHTSKLANLTELSCPNAKVTAGYLDSALTAKMLADKESILPSSHMIVSLLLYKTCVPSHESHECRSPGEERRNGLHMIDFGSCAKATPGRSSASALSLKDLGHILSSLVSGQRSTLYKDKKLAKILRELMGSRQCQSCLLVHVSTQCSQYNETLQVARHFSKLCKVKDSRISRLSSNSSDGSSSASSGSFRLRHGGGVSGGPGHHSTSHHRHGRCHIRMGSSSLSDPDVSSSEQSVDTVIYMGSAGRRTGSDKGFDDRGLTTDSDSGAPPSPLRSPFGAPHRGAGFRGSTIHEEPSEMVLVASPGTDPIAMTVYAHYSNSVSSMISPGGGQLQFQSQNPLGHHPDMSYPYQQRPIQPVGQLRRGYDSAPQFNTASVGYTPSQSSQLSPRLLASKENDARGFIGYHQSIPPPVGTPSRMSPFSVIRPVPVPELQIPPPPTSSPLASPYSTVTAGRPAKKTEEEDNSSEGRRRRMPRTNARAWPRTARSCSSGSNPSLNGASQGEITPTSSPRGENGGGKSRSTPPPGPARHELWVDGPVEFTKNIKEMTARVNSEMGDGTLGNEPKPTVQLSPRGHQSSTSSGSSNANRLHSRPINPVIASGECPSKSRLPQRLSTSARNRRSSSRLSKPTAAVAVEGSSTGSPSDGGTVKEKSPTPPPARESTTQQPVPTPTNVGSSEPKQVIEVETHASASATVTLNNPLKMTGQEFIVEATGIDNYFHNDCGDTTEGNSSELTIDIERCLESVSADLIMSPNSTETESTVTITNSVHKKPPVPRTALDKSTNPTLSERKERLSPLPQAVTATTVSQRIPSIPSEPPKTNAVEKLKRLPCVPVNPLVKEWVMHHSRGSREPSSLKPPTYRDEDGEDSCSGTSGLTPIPSVSRLQRRLDTCLEAGRWVVDGDTNSVYTDRTSVSRRSADAGSIITMSSATMKDLDGDGDGESLSSRRISSLDDADCANEDLGMLPQDTTESLAMTFGLANFDINLIADNEEEDSTGPFLDEAAFATATRKYSLDRRLLYANRVSAYEIIADSQLEHFCSGGGSSPGFGSGSHSPTDDHINPNFDDSDAATAGTIDGQDVSCQTSLTDEISVPELNASTTCPASDGFHENIGFGLTTPTGSTHGLKMIRDNVSPPKSEGSVAAITPFDDRDMMQRPDGSSNPSLHGDPPSQALNNGVLTKSASGTGVLRSLTDYLSVGRTSGSSGPVPNTETFNKDTEPPVPSMGELECANHLYESRQFQTLPPRCKEKSAAAPNSISDFHRKLSECPDVPSNMIVPLYLKPLSETAGVKEDHSRKASSDLGTVVGGHRQLTHASLSYPVNMADAAKSDRGTFCGPGATLSTPAGKKSLSIGLNSPGKIENKKTDKRQKNGTDLSSKVDSPTTSSLKKESTSSKPSKSGGTKIRSLFGRSSSKIPSPATLGKGGETTPKSTSGGKSSGISRFIFPSSKNTGKTNDGKSSSNNNSAYKADSKKVKEFSSDSPASLPPSSKRPESLSPSRLPQPAASKSKTLEKTRKSSSSSFFSGKSKKSADKPLPGKTLSSTSVSAPRVAPPSAETDCAFSQENHNGCDVTYSSTASTPLSPRSFPLGSPYRAYTRPRARAYGSDGGSSGVSGSGVITEGLATGGKNSLSSGYESLSGCVGMAVMTTTGSPRGSLGSAEKFDVLPQEEASTEKESENHVWIGAGTRAQQKPDVGWSPGIVGEQECRRRNEMVIDNSRRRMRVQELLDLQSHLKRELQQAKELRQAPPDSWAFNCPVANRKPSVEDFRYLEALEHETTVLRRRVEVCKSGIQLVTSLV